MSENNEPRKISLADAVKQKLAQKKSKTTGIAAASKIMERKS